MRVALVCAWVACWPLWISGAEPAPSASPKPVSSQAEPARQTVYLGLCPGFELRFINKPRQTHLVREIVRQAFLISARDELGLVTRDAWLGDPMPAERPDRPLEILSKADWSRWEFIRTAGPRRELLAEVALQHDEESWDYGPLAIAAEALSRKQFVEVLKKAGFQGHANRLNPDARPSAEIEEKLADMTFDSQWLAARLLHEAMRTEGESTWMLAALTRAYANLGLLTEFHWHPAHKVFRARSLVYAYRNLARSKQHAWCRYHQAYALALAGWPNWAFLALTDAKNDWNDEGRPKESRPSWVDLLSHYCRYETSKMDPEKALPRDVGLTWLLRFRAVEFSESHDTIGEAAQQALEELPDCYRIHDGLCAVTGVGVGHSATIAPLTRFAKVFYGRLEAMPDLPANVRSVVKQRSTGRGGLFGGLFGRPANDDSELDVQRRPKLVAALIQASRPTAPAKAPDKNPSQEDRKPPQKTDAKNATDSGTADRPAPGDAPSEPRDVGDPSWAALGHMIQEMTFVQVYRRVHFERNEYAVSADEFLEQTKPLVAGHRYRAFLNTFASSSEVKAKALAELAQVPTDDFEWQAAPLLRKLGTQAARPFLARYDHRDFLTGEMKALLESVTSVNPALQLLEISHSSPLARVEIIRRSWTIAQSQAANWERECANQPVVLTELAYTFMSHGRLDDAERCAKAAVKARTDDDTLWFLSEVYAKQGQDSAWLATMRKRLDIPAQGLQHARIHEQIARFHMERREWDQAETHAAISANSYSQWGLEVLASCYEAQQRWKEAEELYQAIAERYSSGRLNRYLFCRRTGHGDLKAAEAFARQAARDEKALVDETPTTELLAYWTLTDQIPKVVSLLERKFNESFNPFLGLRAAILADRRNDAPARDRLLEAVLRDGPKYKKEGDPIAPEVFDLARRIRDDLAHGGKGAIENDWVAKIAVPCYDSSWRATLGYQLACYKRQHGKAEEADQILLGVMGCPRMTISARTLAGAELLAHGVGPDAYREALSGVSKAKPQAK